MSSSIRTIGLALLFLLLVLPASAQRNFNQCASSEPGRTELDHFCPRIEGIHLEGCCPPLFKNPPLRCSYHIPVSRGQAYLGQSSYASCQGGRDVQVSCCRVMKRDCYREPVVLDFLPRLLFRAKTCCFENCPSADYWRRAPANPRITPDHELTAGGVPICTGTVLQECSEATTETCQADSPCPPPDPPSPPSQPTTQPPPGPPTTQPPPSNTGGSTGDSGNSSGPSSPPAPPPVSPGGA